MSRNKVLLSLIFFFVVLIFAVLVVKPVFFQRVIWHAKKTVQSVTQHETKKLSIPLIAQTRNLNCEAATAQMILKYYKKDVDIDSIQKALPLDPNPHKGFRGNVDGNIWGFDDYGVYAEPIAKVMTQMGVPAKAYHGISADFLKQKLFEGKPAIIWVVISDPHVETKEETIQGETVKLVSGEHVAVVTGYENGTWILNDPWRTTKNGERIPQQIQVDDLDSIKWNLFDHMAVIVE